MDILLPRFAGKRIQEALGDTRVVLLLGPRQSGKTTLARQVAGANMKFLTLDDTTALEAARIDPVGFIRGIDKAVIDEAQRAPELLLAIKESVDTDRRPGRFLLTGSANLMTLPRVADSLAGRMETVRLLPLAQAELVGCHNTFLDLAFARGMPQVSDLIVGGELVERVLAGGYPEALGRKSWRRRQDWYRDYVEAMVSRDVRDIAQVDQLYQMPRLLRVLAEHSGQLVNYAGFGSELGMNHVTTQRYTGILESLFLIRMLPPWSTSALKRLTKAHKLHFLDTGLLAALRQLTPESIAKDRTAFGALLESFVFSEILKIASWSDGHYVFSHFRQQDRYEVDIVVEDGSGGILGIEIKAAATVMARDFDGLRRLAAAVGTNFVGGYVFYDGDKVVSFGDQLAAVPLSVLWG